MLAASSNFVTVSCVRWRLLHCSTASIASGSPALRLDKEDAEVVDMLSVYNLYM